MDEVLDLFEFDLGELVESGVQLLAAVVLLLVALVLVVASIFVDGLLLWGVVVFVLGIVAGIFAVGSLLDTFL